MSKLHESWAKLSNRWYQDPVIRAAAREQPAVLTLWPVLVAMSKESSSADNLDGAICIHPDDLANACLIAPEIALDALDKLAKAESVRLKNKHLGVLEISLTQFAKWQTPKGTKQARDERYRDAFAGKTSSIATLARREDDYRQRQRQDKTRQDNLLNPNACAGVREAANRGSGIDEEEEEVNPVRLVFDYWAKVSNRDGARLSGPRVALITARLEDGFSVEQLQRAADAYCSDEWHLGANDKRQRFDTIEVIYRDAAKVERGLELATTSAKPVDTDEYVTLDSGKQKNVTKAVAWMRAEGYEQAMIDREVECLRMGGGLEAQEFTRQKYANGGYE